MDPILLVVVIGVLVVGAALAGVAVSRGRARRPELEPPGRRPLGRPEQPPRPTGTRTAPPEPATDDEAPPIGTIDPALVEQIEDIQVEEVDDTDSGGGADVVVVEPGPEVVAPPVKPRFRDRLTKARALLGDYFGSVLSRDRIDDETWDELEEALIRADVGIKLTGRLLDDLRQRAKAESITAPSALLDALKDDLKKSLAAADRGLRYEPGAPNVWLFVGVNGVGKTTTIGKVARQQRALGRSVVMAAGDTFRAAAAEQLTMWADRTGSDIVRGAEGGDPGAVVFDAVQRAGSRGSDLVLADTAGRLHTKVNLMEELKKVRRVAEREPGRVTETLLVLDATTGQNGLTQAAQFGDAVDVTGVVLTKLDGTAKGGIALAIQAELGLPIKLVGLGESADDLVEFDPDEFVDALFS